MAIKLNIEVGNFYTVENVRGTETIICNEKNIFNNSTMFTILNGTVKGFTWKMTDEYIKELIINNKIKEMYKVEKDFNKWLMT